MPEINEFADTVAGFYKKSSVDQLLAFAWFLEAIQGRSDFDGAKLRECFRSAGIDSPDMSTYLSRLVKKRPPQLVKVGKSYRLTGTVRRSLDQKYNKQPAAIAVSKLLADLPKSVPNIAERDFLKEALDCYKVRAYRASIVMVWNLAYDHIVEWILADQGRVDKLNAGIQKRFPKKNLTIVDRDDFEELKESELIDACRTARLFNKNIVEILVAKLKRRNSAAHPSTIVVTQAQADDSITDLVNNVVLALSR